MKKPRITLIAAISLNGVIGKEGQLPWHLPEDLRHFRQATLGHTVIMGRKTFDSLPCGALEKRRNIVLSRQRLHTMQGVEVANDLATALALCHEDREVFVIGGGEVYRQAIGKADRLLLTTVQLKVDGRGLVSFPPVLESVWEHRSSALTLYPPSGGPGHSFDEYVRRLTP